MKFFTSILALLVLVSPLLAQRSEHQSRPSRPIRGMLDTRIAAAKLANLDFSAKIAVAVESKTRRRIRLIQMWLSEDGVVLISAIKKGSPYELGYSIVPIKVTPALRRSYAARAAVFTPFPAGSVGCDELVLTFLNKKDQKKTIAIRGPKVRR